MYINMETLVRVFDTRPKWSLAVSLGNATAQSRITKPHNIGYVWVCHSLSSHPVLSRHVVVNHQMK